MDKQTLRMSKVVMVTVMVVITEIIMEIIMVITKD